MGYIYMLIDKRNGKKYIGKHNGSYKYYWSSGIIPNKISNKYGKDIFERIILEDNIDNEVLNDKEKFYIDHYNTVNEGYNLTNGGDGGDWTVGKTEEELLEIGKKISERQLGRVFSEETRYRMSESGKVKHFTEEHKIKISESLKGITGRTHTEETKKKLSELKKGVPNPNHSKFMMENNPRARKVSINGIIYKTIKEASEKLGMARHLVKNRLNSKKKEYKDWYKL